MWAMSALIRFLLIHIFHMYGAFHVISCHVVATVGGRAKREFYEHEICSTCTLDGYFSVFESPCVFVSCGGLTGVIVRV